VGRQTVRVGVRISEGNIGRVQALRGRVIAKRHGGMKRNDHSPAIFQASWWSGCSCCTARQVATVKVERRGKVRFLANSS